MSAEDVVGVGDGEIVDELELELGGAEVDREVVDGGDGGGDGGEEGEDGEELVDAVEGGGVSRRR